MRIALETYKILYRLILYASIPRTIAGGPGRFELLRVLAVHAFEDCEHPWCSAGVTCSLSQFIEGLIHGSKKSDSDGSGAFGRLKC